MDAKYPGFELRWAIC